MLVSRNFGSLSDGRAVTAYRIVNSTGEYAEILDYGGILHSLFIKDGNGLLRDVVLGASTAETMGRGTNDGMLVGRCTNRIKDGTYTIDGHVFHLENPNPQMQFLHSGKSNFGSQFFTVEDTGSADSVHLHLEDDGSVGYECLVHADVTYTLTDDHQLVIDYKLTTEGDTLLNPTNHAYFNIGSPDIRTSILQINAETYAKRTECGMPEGAVVPVEGTPLDFRKARQMGEAMTCCGDEYLYDDNFIIDGKGYREMACWTSPEAKLSMKVCSDMPGMVVYSAKSKEPKTGKYGQPLTLYPFVCFETQYISNAVNCEAYEKPVFKAGETLESRTAYIFSTIE